MTGLQSLLRGGATLRQKLFGSDDETLLYDGGTDPIPGYYTPIRYQRQIDELNLRATHEGVWRVTKAAFPGTPEIGKQIIFTENGIVIRMKIDELAGTHPLNPEWILGCNSLGR